MGGYKIQTEEGTRMEDNKQASGFWAGFLVGALVATAISVFVHFMLYQPDDDTKGPQAGMIDVR